MNHLLSILLRGLSPALVLLLTPLSLAAQSGSYGPADFVMAAVLTDPGGLLTPDSVATLDDRFRRAGTRPVAAGEYLWLRLTLRNDKPEPAFGALLYRSEVDSAWVYTRNRDADLQLAYTVARHDPELFAFIPDYHYEVPPGDSGQVYVRLRAPGGMSGADLSRLMLSPGTSLYYTLLTFWSAFYIGLIICIAFLSLILLRLFRNRSFLYFSLLMVSFVAYAVFTSVMFDAINPDVLWIPLFYTIPLVFISVVATITLFIIHYLNLRQIVPHLVPKINLFTGAVLVMLAVPWVIGLPAARAVWMTHLVLILWIVSGLWIILYLRVLRLRSGRRLLSAIVAIAVPALLQGAYVLSTGAFLDALQIALQVGTLVFSGMLLSGLYGQVKELRAEAAELTEQSRMRSRFFANISHEFRTPLTLIMAPLETLLNRAGDDAEERELLGIAYRNAERQLELVNRILKLSRLEENEDLLEARLTDLTGLLQSVTDSFVPAAERKRIDLRLSAPEDDVWVSVDPVKIRDVVYNLLSNAIKFTPEDGRVGVALLLREGGVVLEVSDTGTGIPEQKLSQVFQRFFQLPEQSTTDIPGTGIGLAIVRELVALHGGTVEVESAPGRGTTFRVVLPAERQGAVQVVSGTPTNIRETATEQDEHRGDDDRPHVLVVEDNDELRQLLRRLLEPAYRVTGAGNGAAGVELARELGPDLVLSDVMMPEMDGYDLSKALKASLETSHIPIVLLTARGDRDDRIHGLEYGADDYLTKPYNERELLARIDNLIENRRLLRRRFGEPTAPAAAPAELATNALDEAFLESALKIVDKHLDDVSFKVADFAREINMSTASLNRKLRGLVDQSTNQFVQSVRLQRAAELLATRGHTVGEVADQTGFSSSTYFVRLFREKYGVTPGAYQRDLDDPERDGRSTDPSTT